MKIKKNILFFLLFTAILSNSQKKNIELDTKLDSLYAQSNFPGFAVALVSDKGVEYQKTFGFANISSKLPYTKKSVQNIASVSKTFIGVAIMKCIDLGYFNLETNINDIIPFKIINPNNPSENIKIKHLVTHTSGILDDEDVYSRIFYLNQYSDKKSPLYKSFSKLATIKNRDDTELADFIKNYFDINGKWYKTSNFNKKPVGTEYNYSNIASGLAAYLIDIKSGMTFDLFCEKYIFKPLKMENTSFKFNDSIAKKHVKIYNYEKKCYPLYSEITYPDGSLKTTIEDLSLFLIEMIKGFEGNSNLITLNSYKLLFEKQFNETNLPSNNDSKEPNSGVFWKYKKNGSIGHTGSDVGVTTFMFFNPTTKIGKIFLTNIEFENSFNGKDHKNLIDQFIQVWKILDK